MISVYGANSWKSAYGAVCREVLPGVNIGAVPAGRATLGGARGRIRSESISQVLISLNGRKEKRHKKQAIPLLPACSLLLLRSLICHSKQGIQ